MKNKIKANFFNDQIKHIYDLHENDMIDDDIHIIYSVMSDNHVVCVMNGNIQETLTMILEMLENVYKESPQPCLTAIFEFIGKAVEGEI